MSGLDRLRRRFAQSLVFVPMCMARMVDAADVQPAGLQVITGSVARKGASGRIDVRLRMPSVSPPWPLVVYSHGLGGHLNSGKLWAEAWAAAGFLCVHVLHGPTSEKIFDASSGEATHRRIMESLSHDHVPERCRDIGAVLDRLLHPAQELLAHLDTRHIVIAGHSYGALTAMALAGRTLPQMQRDSRFSAAIALSPGVNPVSRSQSMMSVKRPMLCVTGDFDGAVEIGLPAFRVKAGVPLANRLAVYEALPPGQRALLFLEGADHMTFAGEPSVGRFFGRASRWNPAGEAARQAAVAEWTTVFLKRLRAAESAPWSAQRQEFQGGHFVVG